MAAIYDRFNSGSEQACMQQWRSELLSELTGDVLEIGAGTGANLPHFRSARQVVLTEPDPHMRKRLLKRIAVESFEGDVVDASVDDLPAADGAFDAVVSTLLLCSVPDMERALSEMRRVLKPGGRLVFIEHVAARDNPGRLRWQRRVEPVWKLLAGGCRLTCDTELAIERSGFEIESIRRESMRKAMPLLRPTIRGVAIK